MLQRLLAPRYWVLNNPSFHRFGLVHRHQTMHSVLTDYDDDYNPYDERTRSASAADSEAPAQADAQAKAYASAQPHQGACTGAS